MKYNDDLEKTKDLFDIPEDDVPSPIASINEEGISKEDLNNDFTFGLSGEDAVEGQKEENAETQEEDNNKKKKKKEKKPRRKFKEIWKGWSKKKKVFFCIGIVLVIALIVGLVLFLVFKDEEEVVEEPDDPQVIIEMDNYIYQDGTLIFLNSEGEEIGTYLCNNQSEELCYVPSYTEEDFDGEKNVYEDESVIERSSKIYQDKYVFVYDNEDETAEEIVLYNIETAEIEDTYTLLKGYSDSDLVILRNSNNRYGVIEFTADGYEEILDFSYDFIGRMNSEANLVVNTTDRYYIYSTSGESLSAGLRYEIRSYNSNHIVVDNNGYYVYDYNGSMTYDDAYDYVELLDSYALLIDSGSLFIRDYQGNKYNEEGIELTSTYYNRLNVYSEDLIYTGTRSAYEVSINDGMMDITYTSDNRERTKSINLQHGVMSAKYDYISYFDGVLYFYEDLDKEEILGTYKCSNSNALDLTNCVVATDSFYSVNDLEEDRSEDVGWIPIYNERYVFILDTIDLNNPTIVLYDLESSSTLARYSSVDTGSYTGENKITFVDTDATYVMAQVKSDGDYGLIRISDNVSGTISFDYDFIEKLGDYYQVGSSTGTYKLYNSVGQEITKEYAYKIVNYNGNYVLVEASDGYLVYDFEGNKQGLESDSSYHYVDLQANYYVVIDNQNRLDIRRYGEDGETYHLSQLVSLETSDYEGAYKIVEANGGYQITVTKTNTTYVYDANGVLQ